MDLDPQIVAQNALPIKTARHRGAAQFDRRLGVRLRTVYRVAHIETPADNGLARIYNISDEGLGLKLHIPVMLGDMVTVRLTDDVAITGRVVWTCGADCGLQLSDPVDSEVLLRDLGAQARSAGQRALRMAVNKPAVARSEQGMRGITIQDVSQSGMKVAHDGSFYEGLPVKVSLPSGLERRGVVRWSREGIAGLMLLESFSTNDLGSMKSL